MCRRCSTIILLVLLAVLPIAADPFTVTGAVRSETGDAVAEAQLELLPLLSNYDRARSLLAGRFTAEPVATAETDAAGRFSFVAPSAGVWTLVVKTPDHVPMRYAPLPVAGDLELPPVTLLRASQALIEVTGSNGEPVSGAHIFAESRSSTLWEEIAVDGWRLGARIGLTDARGRLVLPKATGERLRVFGLVAGSLMFAHGEGDERTTLVLSSPSEPEKIVEVRDSAGEPMPEVLVAAGEIAWPVGLTDARGRLALTGGTSEAVELYFFTADGRHLRHRLEAGESSAWVRLSSNERVVGRAVSTVGRRPLAGVLAWPVHDPGRYVLTGVEGTYELIADSAADFWVRLHAEGFLPAGQRLRAVDGGRVATVSLNAAATVVGEVVDKSGRSLSGVQLSAVAGSPRRWRPLPGDRADSRAVSDEEGRFILRRLVPDGSWEVTAAKLGFASATVQVSVAKDLRIALRRARPAFGSVLDADGAPLAGAEVVLLPSHTDDARPAGVRAATDAKGRFAVAAVPSERLDLVARKPGWAPLTVRGVTVPAGSGDVDLGILQLVPAASIEGLVTDLNGKPISDVGIWRTGEGQDLIGATRTPLPDREPDAKSAVDGRFRLDDLTAGRTVDLRIYRPGFLPVTLPGVEARLPKESATPPLVVVLKPASEIRGRVLDEHGDPLPAARVVLREPPPSSSTVGVQARRGDREKTTVTDARGRFAFAGVAPGPSEVEASHPEFRRSPPQPLEVPAAATVDGLTVVLVSGAEVEGRVTATDGEPVAGVRIRVGEASAVSDADGGFRVAGVVTGRQFLVAQHLGFERYTEEIEVESGSQIVDVVLAGGREVSGRVVSENGSNIAGARVHLELDPADGEIRRYQAMTGSDGRFELARVVDGLYEVTAEAGGYGAVSRSLRMEGASAEIELKLPAAAVVAGQIYGLELEELASVHIEATQDDRWQRPGRIDFDGGYEIRDLGPGIWHLRAWLPGGRRQAEARVALDPGQRRQERDLEFLGSSLRGLVRLDGEPLPAATVELAGQESAVRRSLTSDHLGRFHFADLVPGSYRLDVAQPLRGILHNQEVELTGDLELTVEIAAARVEGVVKSATSARPLPDALIYVRRLLGADGSTPAALVTVATDHRGGFALGRLSAGRYSLSARKDGYTSVEKLLHLDPGEQRQIQLELTPTEGLELLVRPASGARPPAFVHLSVLASSGLVLSETRALDGEGFARFPVVPPGVWDLIVGGPGVAVTQVRAEVPGAPVEVAASPAARLEVRIPPLVEENLVADLTVRTPDGKPFLGFGPDGRLRQQWRLQAGSGFIEGLPGGIWTLDVLASDGRLWQQTVVAHGGDQMRVVIE